MGAAFVANKNGVLTAIKQSSGEKIWEFNTAAHTPGSHRRRRTQIVGTPAFSPDGAVVYIGDKRAKQVWAVDAASGTKLWATEPYKAIEGVQPQPSPDGTVLYVAGYRMTAYSTADGSQLWQTTQAAQVVAGSLYSSGGLAVSRNGRRIFGTTKRAGSVKSTAFSINSETGAEEWKTELDSGSSYSSKCGVILSPWGRTLYVTNGDAVIALATSDGSERWTSASTGGENIISQPIMSTDGSVLYITVLKDYQVWAISTVDGSKVWASIELGNRWIYSGVVLSLDGSVLYVGVRYAGTGAVVALDTSDGTKLWESASTLKEIKSTPALSDDGLLVIVGDIKGNVYGFSTTDGVKQWENINNGQPSTSAMVYSPPTPAPDPLTPAPTPAIVASEIVVDGIDCGSFDSAAAAGFAASIASTPSIGLVSDASQITSVRCESDTRAETSTVLGEDTTQRTVTVSKIVFDITIPPPPPGATSSPAAELAAELTGSVSSGDLGSQLAAHAPAGSVLASATVDAAASTAAIAMTTGTVTCCVLCAVFSVLCHLLLSTTLCFALCCVCFVLCVLLSALLSVYRFTCLT